MEKLGYKLLFIASALSTFAGIRMDILKIFDFWGAGFLGLSLCVANFAIWHDEWALQHISKAIPSEEIRRKIHYRIQFVIAVGFALLAAYLLGSERGAPISQTELPASISDSVAPIIRQGDDNVNLIAKEQIIILNPEPTNVKELEQSIARMEKRTSMDPEDAENKYVRPTGISTPLEGKGQYAVLLEFGVTKLNTDATIVTANFKSNVLHYEDWYGVPESTKRQTRPGAVRVTTGHFVSRATAVSKEDTNKYMTPRQSYYLYVECETPVTGITVTYLAEEVSMKLEDNERQTKSNAFTRLPSQQVSGIRSD